MRRSGVLTLFVLASVLGLVFSASLPRGYAQTPSGPVGDEFNATSFAAPFKLICGGFASQPCPDAQGPLTWSLDANSSGVLRIWTQFGSLEGTAGQASNNARNLVVQPVSSGSDYVVTTKLTFPATSNATSPLALGQTAGIIVYQDDDNFIYVGRQFTTAGSSQLRFVQETGGADLASTYSEAGIVPQPIYLRIVKTATTYQAFWSTDNVTFTPLAPAIPATATPTSTATGTPTATPGATPTNTALPAGYTASYTAPQVGLFAWGGTNSQVNTNMLAADFDWFRVGTNSQTPAPSPAPTATTTAAPTSTAAVTSTPTATATATATVAPTPTNTAVVPTPTPKPVSHPYVLRFKWVSLWYHVVREGTFDVIRIQANHKTTLGIWAHVIFPNGKHFDWYTNTDRNGYWSVKYPIPGNALSKFSNQGRIALQLWHGKKTRKTFLTFTVVKRK